MRACAREGDFFLFATKICANESSSSWSDFDLKNEPVKYEKNVKLTFEVSI